MKNYTEEEIKAMRKLHRETKNSVMQRKYLAICLHMEGNTNKRIADIIGLDEHTISIYINTYDAQGTEGLIPKKSPGRPKLLTDEQAQKLYETISEKAPDDVGFDGVMNWTAKIACLWVLQEFGIQYKISSMWALFQRLKLSYTRPTYVLAKADPQKQEQFKKDFDEEKKNF